MTLDLSAVQSRLDRSPFLSWLGLRIESFEAPSITLRLPWKDTFVATPELGGVNGGIIATLLDCAASYAVICQTGKLYVTADLRVDYHRRAAAGPLRVTGRSVRIGRTLATSDASLYDTSQQLIASGRATFISRDLNLKQESK